MKRSFRIFASSAAVVAAGLVLPAFAGDDVQVHDWPVGNDGRPIVFGEFDSRMSGARSGDETATGNLKQVSAHLVGDRCEAKAERIGELVTTVSGQVSAARVNSRLVLDIARSRLDAQQPVTYVVRSDVMEMQLALQSELERVRAARTAKMNAEVAAALDAAEAAIAAAAASLEVPPED